MSKRFCIVLAVLIIAVFGGVVWMARNPTDRNFQGRPESVWINGLGITNSEAEVQQWQGFGSEGIPLLVKGLRKGSGPWDRFYSKLWSKLPSVLSRRLSKPTDSSATRARSALILGRMGSDAEIAVPALVQALNDEYYGARMNACGALNHLLPGMGNEKVEILPRLIEATRDPYPSVRYNALLCLTNYPDQVRLVIPAVVNALSDADPPVRSGAIKSLGQLDFKGAQGACVPALLKLMDDDNLEVRVSATNTLKTIDPEAAAKAGVR